MKNMMISRGLVVLSVAALAGIGLVGCGDDDGTTPVDSGGPVDSGPGMMDAGPVDAGPGGTDAGPGMTDGGGGGGACTNASDLMAIMQDYADGGPADGGVGVATLAGQCGPGCLSAADFQMCVSSCVRAGTGNAVSMACTDCVGLSAACTAGNCISVCLSDPRAPACLACQCGDNADHVNCLAAYTACSGIPPSFDCGTLDAGM